MEQGDAQFRAHPAAPLAVGTSLHRRYSIRGLLRADSCTLTYDGFDYIARQPITVLEFFPAEIAVRAEGSTAASPIDREYGELYFFGMEAFYRQYDKLMQAIGNPNILSIFDAFFENGTAYAVAETPDGLTLAEYLDMQRRKLTDGELTYILRAVTDALLVVHSLNMLHHGISEQSVLLCTDGTVKLTGFAAGRRTVEDRRAVRDDEPWNDIRAFGETLRRAYVETNADTAASDPVHLAQGAFDTLFCGMLSGNPSLRFSSVFDLRYTADSIEVEPARPIVTKENTAAYRRRPKTCIPEESASLVQHQPVSPRRNENREEPRNSAKWVALAIGAVLLTLIGVLIWVLAKW